MDHQAIIILVISYTLVGAFVFTVLLTCLSLTGWIEFKYPNQQKKLFNVLIVELVVVCLAFFKGFLDPVEVQNKIESKISNASNYEIEELSYKILELEDELSECSKNSIGEFCLIPRESQFEKNQCKTVEGTTGWLFKGERVRIVNYNDLEVNELYFTHAPIKLREEPLKSFFRVPEIIAEIQPGCQIEILEEKRSNFTDRVWFRVKVVNTSNKPLKKDK